MTILDIEVVYSGEPEKQAPQYRKLQRGIKGVLAEWESDETSQRTYKRHHYRVQQGKWRGGNIPYGILPDGQGWFTPDPESYAVLTWILGKRGEGLGYHTIARMLNEGIALEEGAEPQVPPTPGLLITSADPIWSVKILRLVRFSMSRGESRPTPGSPIQSTKSAAKQ